MPKAFNDPTGAGARVDMHYEVDIGGVRRRIELPFVTAVFADLHGQPMDPPEALADRKMLEIDASCFDAVMAELAPRLVFGVPNVLTDLGELAIELHFKRICDFEPDHWICQVEGLRLLTDARDHATPAERAELDQRIDSQASLICHHDRFKQLEASWRGLHRLVTESECDETLKIRVLSVSRVELSKVLKRYKGTGWDQSPIFKRLYSEGIGSAGGEPIGCVVLDFAFDHSPDDIEMLAELSKIAAASYAPMLAAAAPALMQMESWQELPTPRALTKIFTIPEYAAWHSLRESDDSRYLVLTLPRYLSRQPHGVNGSSGTNYTFRETATSHADFLWCNAAYLLAEKLHRAFKVYGWCARFEGLLGGAVEGLPRTSLRTQGGLRQTLCPTEVPIDDRRVAEVVREGLMPIVARGDLNLAVFNTGVVLNKPAEYDDADATENARLAAVLSFVLATSRLSHYLKAIGRDVLSPIRDLESAQECLRTWIADYVAPAPIAPDAFASPLKPFAAAEVKVQELSEAPGAFQTTFWVRLADWVRK